MSIVHIRICVLYGGGEMPGWLPGSVVSWYIAESPKQGSKRFHSITKTIHFISSISIAQYHCRIEHCLNILKMQKCTHSVVTFANVLAGECLLCIILLQREARE